MIRIANLSMHVGTFRLEKVSLEIPTGSYGVLMGPTGGGKTTLLEAVAGLKSATGGQIVLEGRDVTLLKPAERNIGYVPQDGALFTTMSVSEHLGFALAVRHVKRQEIQRRVEELAELLRIGELLGRTVRDLSGGERQRVALGRALSFRPATLLLDEPLSALDDGTREEMYVLLEEVKARTGVTALHVTHNADDAIRLADCLFRLEAGQLKRSGGDETPQLRATKQNGGNNENCDD
jgi:molybdate/tungstate transport system ATP-binding protein